MARGIPSLTSALTSSAITLSRAASMAAIKSSMAEWTLAAGVPVSATGSSGSSAGLASLALAAFPSLDSLGMGLLTIINVLSESYPFAGRGKPPVELLQGLPGSNCRPGKPMLACAHESGRPLAQAADDPGPFHGPARYPGRRAGGVPQCQRAHDLPRPGRAAAAWVSGRLRERVPVPAGALSASYPPPAFAGGGRPGRPAAGRGPQETAAGRGRRHSRRRHPVPSLRGCRSRKPGRGGRPPPAPPSLLSPTMVPTGRLAQLVRALGSHPRGRGFESPADHSPPNGLRTGTDGTGHPTRTRTPDVGRTCVAA